MNKFVLILLVLITACAPQAATSNTVQPSPTPVVAPSATATIIPTPTVSPAFLSIQKAIAGGTENYTLMGNGEIQAKLADGTTAIISGIRLNPDGTSYTIEVNGSPVTVDVDQVSISDDNGVVVEGYERVNDTDEYRVVEKSPAQVWAEQNGGGFDKVEGVAWDQETGLVIWAKDAKGEWINYPDGNVPIPPGPGYENEPPLMVPYYHSFNKAMAVITNELPWDEPLHVYREKQNEHIKWLYNTYWRSLEVSFGEFSILHSSADPSSIAEIYSEDVNLGNAEFGTLLGYQSSRTNFLL